MILVAIGANLPATDGAAPAVSVRRAAAALDALPGLRLAALSALYETAPMPPAGQPPYINAVARLVLSQLAASHPVDAAEPARLLGALHGIEAAAGRRRGVPNAARTLDLDLIDLNGMLRDAPDPVLPHPRAHLRAFVLAPLLEIAPDWVHPRLGRAGAALLAGLPAQAIRRLPEGFA